LRKLVPDLRVDLSAIAKGHGVDRLAQLLDQLQVEAYFVEIGGEVRTRGNRPDGQPWQVGIERPVEGERAVQSIIGLSGRSLATSGDYRNFFEQDGRRINHFIDPKTGQPVASQLASVSVVADNCALADALATGLMASGYDKGLRLAEDHGWAVMMIARAGDGLEVIATPQFESLSSQPLNASAGSQP
jgi:thiamine biosynthesis lipoprotein